MALDVEDVDDVAEAAVLFGPPGVAQVHVRGLDHYRHEVTLGDDDRALHVAGGHRLAGPQWAPWRKADQRGGVGDEIGADVADAHANHLHVRFVDHVANRDRDAQDRNVDHRIHPAADTSANGIG